MNFISKIENDYNISFGNNLKIIINEKNFDLYISKDFDSNFTESILYRYHNDSRTIIYMYIYIDIINYNIILIPISIIY